MSPVLLVKSNNHILFLSLVVFTLVTVACGGGSSKNKVSPPVNLAPTVSAGTDQNVDALMYVTLTGNASDSDGSIVSYQWQQTTGVTVRLENNNTTSATFFSPSLIESTQLEFTLTVTDNSGASATDNVLVTIAADPTPLWEPSLVNDCNINQNISPTIASAPLTLKEVGQRIFEPSIIFSDQTFTWLSKEDVGPSVKAIEILRDSGHFRSVDGDEAYLAYDDGTHGDQLANDGIFTRSCLFVDSDVLINKDFIESSNLWVIDSAFRDSENAYYIAPNVRVNNSGFFIELGNEYTTRFQNQWLLHSPQWCHACELAWQLSGDIFDFFSVAPRDPFGGAGYVRVHDNITGTGFTPPCNNNSYCYSIIDGNEHQKLSGIIWNGWPGLDGFNHELGHGLLGMEAHDFPETGNRAWNSGDLMHLDSDITVTGELSGPFWDPDRGWPYAVQLQMPNGERSEVYLTQDNDGNFRLQPMDEQNRVWGDILLYMMGLLNAEQVDKTYYKLYLPELTGCISEDYSLVCTNNLVLAQETIPFTIQDFINKFGQRSAPDFFDPKNLTIGVLNISDRPHTNAEIVWMTKLNREFSSDSATDTNTWFKATTWSTATRSLSSININAVEFTNNRK